MDLRRELDLRDETIRSLTDELDLRAAEIENFRKKLAEQREEIARLTHERDYAQEQASMQYGALLDMAGVFDPDRSTSQTKKQALINCANALNNQNEHGREHFPRTMLLERKVKKQRRRAEKAEAECEEKNAKIEYVERRLNEVSEEHRETCNNAVTLRERTKKAEEKLEVSHSALRDTRSERDKARAELAKEWERFRMLNAAITRDAFNPTMIINEFERLVKREADERDEQHRSMDRKPEFEKHKQSTTISRNIPDAVANRSYIIWGVWR